MRILVAYASKAGATKGIADRIGETLRRHGLDADVQEVGAVRNVVGYDAFVIGSSLYMFHWNKEAKQFVSRNKATLSGRPVWLFSSGPVGTEAKDPQGRDVRETSGPKEIDELREAVKPRDHQVFFGALDGSKLTGTMGFTYRLVRRSKAARESMPEGDFRDWKEIEAWADGIASSLERSPASPGP
jgi:menaquinone-dependent protoporphyrinogen oxidase